jgi:hypothetical protein
VASEVRAGWAAAGVSEIPAAMLGHALTAASRAGEAQVAVLPVNWKRMPGRSKK